MKRTKKRETRNGRSEEALLAAISVLEKLRDSHNKVRGHGLLLFGSLIHKFSVISGVKRGRFCTFRHSDRGVQNTISKNFTFDLSFDPKPNF